MGRLFAAREHQIQCLNQNSAHNRLQQRLGEPRPARLQSLRAILGVAMDSWKKAAVVGSIGAATILFLKKRYPAGVLATGVGLAMLASEYPEKFEKVRRALPQYFERGMRIMEMAGQAGRRVMSAAERRTVEAWEEIGG